MAYSKSFTNLINRIKDSRNEDLNFVGLGNPDAKILFISKECAIDRSDTRGKLFYEAEQTLNAKYWDRDINDIDSYNLPEWFNPSKPYEGAVCVKAIRDEDGSICNNGTTGTWICYQKITDGFFGNVFSENNNVDFYKDSFITELSCVENKYGSYSNATKTSINDRCYELLSDDFYRSFPIVIMNCGRYVKDYDINICKVFNQKYKTTRKYDDGWMRIYENDGRILLLTPFLASCPDSYLDRIVRTLRRFVEKQKLDYCVYYDGSNKSIDKHIFAYYERCWIWQLFLYGEHYENDIKCMNSFGITNEWIDSFNIPRSLVALFFNRYMHWAVMGNFDKEAFMHWFEKIRNAEPSNKQNKS